MQKGQYLPRGRASSPVVLANQKLAVCHRIQLATHLTLGLNLCSHTLKSQGVVCARDKSVQFWLVLDAVLTMFISVLYSNGCVLVKLVARCSIMFVNPLKSLLD